MPPVAVETAMANQPRRRKAARSGASRRINTTSVTVQGPPWFRRDWFWGLILVLFVLLAYSPIWHAGFIWDDDAMLTANPCIVGPFGLKEIWTTSAADICPLVITTFWVEHALCGLEPLPYHLVNIVMHGACAVLLWRVFRSLRVPGAWLGAALWALHPVEVESVAWITEMKNTESCLFFLLSILFFVRHVRAKELNERNGGGWNYRLSLLFAALAMASKSSTVILPVVLCLCACWIEGRWHWRNVARVAPMFLMSVAAGAVSIWTQGLQMATATPDPQWVRSWPERLAAAGDAIWFYLGKLLWPDPLITIYPRWQIDAGQWVSYLPLLAVIVVFSILWLKRRSGVAGSRACFFAFAYFMTALLPVLGLIDNSIFRYSLVFDHLQYLASIGPLALAGAGLARFSDFVLPKRLLWLQAALCGGLLMILGLATRQRTWVYEGQETLWSDTLAKNPNCSVGYTNLGFAFFRKGRADEALEQFQKALEINPNDMDAHNDLGIALDQIGRLDEAIAQYQKALEINPNYAEAHNNLGDSLVQKGQLGEAVEQYQMAVKINPKYAQAHGNLGVAFFQEGQLDEAIAQYHKALEINPNYAEAHNNLGDALLQNGQLGEAIEECQRAVKINPKFAQAHGNLGLVFFQKGQLDEAITEFQKALRLNPNLRTVRDSLAKAQALLNDASK